MRQTRVLMMTHAYVVEVSFNGELVSEHFIEAADALSAINRIEAQYGEPPRITTKTIYHENGSIEHVLVVMDWHGYCFHARKKENGT
jgi:hypothetical protein